MGDPFQRHRGARTQLRGNFHFLRVAFAAATQLGLRPAAPAQFLPKNGKEDENENEEEDDTEGGSGSTPRRAGTASHSAFYRRISNAEPSQADTSRHGVEILPMHEGRRRQPGP